MYIKINEHLTLANGLYKAGEFSQAESVYMEMIKQEPNNYQAVLGLGRIKLLSNSLKEAANRLKKAIDLNPADNEPKSLLAEAYHREDNFKEAAPLYHAVGRKSVADQSNSLIHKIPYHIEDTSEETIVKFMDTDPLPLVKCRINNGEEALFLIDTGAPEMVIDTEFAAKNGVAVSGEDTVVFAGGQKGSIQLGVVDNVTLGGFKIKNVPVHLHTTKGAKGLIINGQQISGIIGTVLFYHFISTLDYPNGQLILQCKTAGNQKKLRGEVRSGKFIKIPFWMAGDHFSVAWGTINKSKPLLFFIDTGMAGGGFSCPGSTLKEANVQMSQDSPPRTGIGGGGMFQLSRGVIDELTLGDAKEKNIPALIPTINPFSLEYQFGFRIAGIISHAFFRPYKVIFDFMTMNLFLKRSSAV